MLCGLLVVGMSACCNKQAMQTVTGVVIGTSADSVAVVTLAGDTLTLCTVDTDSTTVQPAITGDSVEVCYTPAAKPSNGSCTRSKVAELKIIAQSPMRLIAGEWIEPNPIDSTQVQGFVLNQDGTASSVNMATLLFTKWNWAGKQLLLNSRSIGNGVESDDIDTLSIDVLSSDSLVLSRNGQVVWRMARKAQ